MRQNRHYIILCLQLNGVNILNAAQVIVMVLGTEAAASSGKCIDYVWDREVGLQIDLPGILHAHAYTKDTFSFGYES